MARERVGKPMNNPWAVFMEGASFVMACQEVVAWRLLCLAIGQGVARREAGRMVTEKVVAVANANIGAALALPRGPQAAVKAAGGTYKRAVRRNLKRLRRS